MSLATYADACRGLAEELVESLDEDGIAALRLDLAASGMRAWLAWCAAHAKAVASFAAATPAVRSKRVAWRQGRLRLTLAAYQHCMEAADLLQVAANLSSGGSYRSMAAQAGTASKQLGLGGDWPDWPWDDPDPLDAC